MFSSETIQDYLPCVLRHTHKSQDDCCKYFQILRFERDRFHDLKIISWETFEGPIPSTFTPNSRSIRDFREIASQQRDFLAMRKRYTAFQIISFLENVLFDEFTKFSLNVPLIERIRNAGWFRTWSDIALVKFYSAQKICSFQKRELLVFEASLADAPDFAEITMEGTWKLSDGKIISTFKSEVYFRMDVEYGLKCRLFEVKEIPVKKQENSSLLKLI